VDLWLHGFAMLHEDTAMVPLFRRGYRDEITVAKNRDRIATALDSNRTTLMARFNQNRNLFGLQFAALYFGSWDEMRTGIDLFLRAEGDPRRASDPQAQQVIAFFAQQLPSPADREWLRLFTASLVDEGRKFHHAWWVTQTRDRASVLARVDSIWQRSYREKLQAFLNNSGQAAGDFILSLTLGGEGRTVSGGKQQNIITTNFPAAVANAEQAIYVFAHEAVGALAATAIRDNVTPAEQREGAADRYQSPAAVRAGYMLLQRTIPELAPGYARYYLSVAGKSSSSNLDSAMAAGFPLPDIIRDAIRRQLDIVLGGI
jgi:hypothetical protein